jgi:SAM-dependent methyltransferase
MGYKEITECRACGGSDLKKFIDLGSQPLANSYHDGTTELPEYPLAVNVCRNCWHTQLTVVVDPDEMFKHYLYASGTTNTLKDYFKWFAEATTEVVFGSGRDLDHFVDTEQGTYPNVLDIACNDGSQLDHFKPMMFETIGVDPARNLAPEAKKKGHNIYTDYWTEKVALKIRKYCGRVDILIAQNVFAHTHDILSFLLACKEIMHTGSRLFIQTSQANMYVNGEFDTIYHEHLSFFNTKSMKAVVERAGLHLHTVSKTPIHGTSYVFTIGTEPNTGLYNNVQQTMEIEQFEGLYEIGTYFEFAERAEKTLKALKEHVEWSKQHGDIVVGYGAAAKAMTLLNAGKIKLDYIVDDSPLKQGLLTPGMNIPIVPVTALTAASLAIIPLAWNFFEEIKTRVYKALPGKRRIRFIKYFPRLEW